MTPDELAALVRTPGPEGTDSPHRRTLRLMSEEWARRVSDDLRVHRGLGHFDPTQALGEMARLDDLVAALAGGPIGAGTFVASLRSLLAGLNLLPVEGPGGRGRRRGR